MPPTVPSVKLNNGHSMPAFGLGTWQMDEAEAETAVKQAIDLGYRHFDTAFIYHNEVAIGKAVRQKIKENVVKREDIFIVSKLWNTCHAKSEVLPACRRSHTYLSLDYIDLYLVHWPFGLKSKTESRNPQVFDGFDDTSLEDTWREMEKCVDQGLVRSIGLSNFNSLQVDRIIKIARIKPVCNQIEVHVGFHQQKLIHHCRQKSVEVVGYCPLGAPNRPVKRRNEKSVLDQPAVMQIASVHGKTPAQVALRYLLIHHCRQKSVEEVGYCPLGAPNRPVKRRNEKSVLDQPAVMQIASVHGKILAQVALRYLVQLGVTPIPKSNTTQHMKDNINIFDFKLSEEEMTELDKLNTDERVMLYPLARHHTEWPFKIPF
ncbi:aldo-keto reductase family 1 member B7-like [Macrosteles quadrilineatus]|uniref:aldo-keto reductase family 1 member B7-like n=1 Tax=Macrosteles quadrilineatus TaxID=74068 RepID=UPI0023E13DAF|nr:aldo-keto reductase family 1 member B7-like [Macrosteles quadrilineatus]